MLAGTVSVKPWTDRNGDISVLKLVTIVALCAPGAWLLWALQFDQLGPRPITAAIHEAGDWAIRFLLLSLAITPLRRIGNWPRLVLIRRMVGLAALFYGIAHLGLYVADLKFDLPRVASEIVSRIYLTIGFVALMGLAVLGATSTDRAVRRLGRNWGRLHKASYGLAVLALLHFFMQSKLDVTEAALMSGLFLLAMGYRVAHWRGYATSVSTLFAVAIIASLATVGVEAGWYAVATGVKAERVLLANLDLAWPLRPAWWVLVVGTVIALLPLVRRRRSRRTATSRRVSASQAGGAAVTEAS